MCLVCLKICSPPWIRAPQILIQRILVQYSSCISFLGPDWIFTHSQPHCCSMGGASKTGQRHSVHAVRQFLIHLLYACLDQTWEPKKNALLKSKIKSNSLKRPHTAPVGSSHWPTPIPVMYQDALDERMQQVPGKLDQCLGIGIC